MQHHGSEEAPSQSKLATLQERIGVEEQAARDDERVKCQKFLDKNIKGRDVETDTRMQQRIELLQQQL
eukprot:7182992-Prorocentrum_lima.AAC.1